MSFGIVGSTEAAATGGSGWGSDAARGSKLRPNDACISFVVDDVWSVPDDSGETTLRLAMIRAASFSMSRLLILSTSATLAASHTRLATKPYEHLPFLFAATFSMYRLAYPRTNTVTGSMAYSRTRWDWARRYKRYHYWHTCARHAVSRDRILSSFPKAWSGIGLRNFVNGVHQYVRASGLGRRGGRGRSRIELLGNY